MRPVLCSSSMLYNEGELIKLNLETKVVYDIRCRLTRKQAMEKAKKLLHIGGRGRSNQQVNSVPQRQSQPILLLEPPPELPPGPKLEPKPDRRVAKFLDSLPPWTTPREREIGNVALASFKDHISDLRRLLGESDRKLEEQEQAHQEHVKEEARKAAHEAREARTEYDREYQSLRAQLQKERSNSKRVEAETKANHDQEKQSLLANLNKLEHDFQRELEVTKLKHDQECQRLSEEHEKMRQDFFRQISMINKKHEQEIRNWETSFDAAKNASRRDQADLQAKHGRKVQELNREHQSQIEGVMQDAADARSRHQAEIRGLEQKHRQKIEEAKRNAAEAKNRHEAEMLALEQQHSRETEVERIRHSTEVKKLRETHDNQKASLIANHTKQTQHLQNQERELNRALLSRDDEVYRSAMFSTSGLPQMTDPKLKEKLLEIEVLVNDISNLSWKPDQSVCPERVLERHGARYSLRRLKKAILSDIIWCMLYHYVFASPFRMFGESGNEMERQWMAKTTDGSTLPDPGRYKWPPATTATERWRYMTLQECRDVLKQPVLSQFDPRAQLKKGFSDTGSTLTGELTATIQSLAAVDDDTMMSVSKLSKKVPKLWLEFSLHRPRIMIDQLAQGFIDVPQRFAQIGRGEIVLTITPMLGRYGNNEGADLDRFTIVKDGEALSLP